MKKLSQLLCAAVLSTASTLAGAQATFDTTNLYQIENVNSSYLMDVSGGSQSAGTNVVQWANTGAPDLSWHLIPAGNSEYWIVNNNSGQCLGISNASMAAGAYAVQWADNGTNDHLWTIISVGNGEYKIKNVNSGLVLGVSGASKTEGAQILQWTDNGTRDHLWRFNQTTTPSYVAPGYVTGNVVPVADPSMINASGTYYLYATGGPIQVRYSSDRTTFNPSNLVYALPGIPSWAAAYNSTDLWAPDVSYSNGQYLMYYAASTFGTNTSAIGLATSTTGAAGSWTDSGSSVITSNTCPNSNAIDPGLLKDSNGNWWLSFGSFWDGINMIQMDPSTDRPLTSNRTCYSLANRLVGTAIEGAYVYPHGGYYYLFASLDTCCQGTSSTYHVIVGRSSSPNGPFVDRGGVAMTQGGGTIVLATHGSIIGPGGQSVFLDTNGQDVFVYHYYDGNNHGYPTLGINLLAWSPDEWPSVN